MQLYFSQRHSVFLPNTETESSFLPSNYLWLFPQAPTVDSSHLNLVLKLGMCGLLTSLLYKTLCISTQNKNVWINKGGHA